MKDQDARKICNRCGANKPLAMFPICDYRNGKTRYRADCKECYNEKARRGRPRKIICQINEDERICTSCNTVKPNDEFSNVGRDNHSGKVYKNGVCKDCKKNRDIGRLYQISGVEYDEMYREQGGLCAICKGVNKSNRKLSIDHNHITGEIRGLLCTKCNLGLGQLMADDGTDILLAAIKYLS